MAHNSEVSRFKHPTIGGLWVGLIIFAVIFLGGNHDPRENLLPTIVVAAAAAILVSGMEFAISRLNRRNRP